MAKPHLLTDEDAKGKSVGHSVSFSNLRVLFYRLKVEVFFDPVNTFLKGLLVLAANLVTRVKMPHNLGVSTVLSRVECFDFKDPDYPFAHSGAFLLR